MQRTTSITLGSHQQQFIESLVESGRYTSTSEIVRDALRKLEESQGPEWLLSQLAEGEKGVAEAWDDDALFSHVKEEAKKRGDILRHEVHPYVVFFRKFSYGVRIGRVLYKNRAMEKHL